MTLQVWDALKSTTCMNGCIELVAYSLADIHMDCYLSMLNLSGVDVVKLVKVGLTDYQFEKVLNFLGKEAV